MTLTWFRLCLRVMSRGILAAMVFGAAESTSLGQTPKPLPLSAAQQKTLDEGADALKAALALAARPTADIVDAAIFQKGVQWALRYDNEFTAADVVLLQNAIARGTERAKILALGRQPWRLRKGKIGLGYVSRLDGSVQPYGLIVPKSYSPNVPMRLDVVLHGSTRPVGMSELRFLATFDGPDDDSASGPDQPFIELHPLGRVENCYRWAGETDVFEAIDDVCQRYNVDRDRIVLRGMSMGASGTWHLGLKHPDRFAALGPYCGYVDTHRFSETPLPNFVKVGPLPKHQELGLHMLDSIDYAANAGVVPVVACMGEKDVFFQAHVLMGEAMQREGLTMVNLISPGTGHVIDPVTHAEQLRRIGQFAATGVSHQPRDLRFVTWTLKYSHCHWLQALGLARHYSRAELRARLNDDVVEIAEPQNITSFAILTRQLSRFPKRLRIGTTDLVVPDAIPASTQGIVVSRANNAWRIAGELGHLPLAGKRPGLQGPIDDAFTSPFVCVRGTGQPWNPAVQAYADESLKRFSAEWHHYFRGELPVKDDTAVTTEDVQTRNLILFGDPGSNPWIARVLPHLPLTWSKDILRMPPGDAGQPTNVPSIGDRRAADSEVPAGPTRMHDYPSANYVPAMIAPNPLANASDHYVVLNSGHTFHEAELAKLNYLLFPRWGDWAVLKIDTEQLTSKPRSETVVSAGFFDEQWLFSSQRD